jgi:hypothetical protein
MQWTMPPLSLLGDKKSLTPPPPPEARAERYELLACCLKELSLMQKPAPGDIGSFMALIPPGLIMPTGWINYSLFCMLLLLKLVIGIELQEISSSMIASSSPPPGFATYCDNYPLMTWLTGGSTPIPPAAGWFPAGYCGISSFFCCCKILILSNFC